MWCVDLIGAVISHSLVSIGSAALLRFPPPHLAVSRVFASTGHACLSVVCESLPPPSLVFHVWCSFLLFVSLI